MEIPQPARIAQRIFTRALLAAIDCTPRIDISRKVYKSWMRLVFPTDWIAKGLATASFYRSQSDRIRTTRAKMHARCLNPVISHQSMLIQTIFIFTNASTFFTKNLRCKIYSLWDKLSPLLTQLWVLHSRILLLTSLWARFAVSFASDKTNAVLLNGDKL